MSEAWIKSDIGDCEFLKTNVQLYVQKIVKECKIITIALYFLRCAINTRSLEQ